MSVRGEQKAARPQKRNFNTIEGLNNQTRAGG